MSALYSMRYQGVQGEGHGCIYIGNGKVLGTDVTGAIYKGTYQNVGPNLVGNVTLTSAGGYLVTGQPIPAGTQVPISFNLIPEFGDGRLNTVSVAGHPVQVGFRVIGDI